MSNRFLGEVTVDGNGRRYRLRCDFNAMCEFESATDEDAMAVFQRFETGKVGVKTMRAMMWAFLRHHHPEVTLTEAGDLLSFDSSVLMAVIQAASPTAQEAKGLGNGRRRKGKGA